MRSRRLDRLPDHADLLSGNISSQVRAKRKRANYTRGRPNVCLGLVPFGLVTFLLDIRARGSRAVEVTAHRHDVSHVT